MFILILGASVKTGKEFEIYECIASVCRLYGDKVLSPVDSLKFKGTLQARHDRAVSLIEKADLIIAEDSGASTGLGYELGLARGLGKDVIFVRHFQAKPSLSRGGFEGASTVEYSLATRDDLGRKITMVLEGRGLTKNS